MDSGGIIKISAVVSLIAGAIYILSFLFSRGGTHQSPLEKKQERAPKVVNTRSSKPSPLGKGAVMIDRAFVVTADVPAPLPINDENQHEMWLSNVSIEHWLWGLVNEIEFESDGNRNKVKINDIQRICRNWHVTTFGPPDRQKIPIWRKTWLEVTLKNGEEFKAKPGALTPLRIIGDSSSGQVTIRGDHVQDLQLR